jgi:hypothetical protein
MKMELVTVTPEMAREWLESNNGNRPLRGDNVKALARDMRSGDWRLVGDPIRIDRLGNLIDGQHRLAAVVDSGVAVPFFVGTGLDPEDKRVIDSGIKRRPGDQLVMDGRAQGVALASALRLMYSLEVGRPYDGSLKVTNAELFHTAERHPTMLDSLLATRGLSRLVYITPMNATVAHYLGYVKIPATTYDFFNKLRTAVNCTATDPALLLRNRMTSGYERPGRLAQLWLVLHALILTKDGVDTYTNLQLPRGSKVTPDRVLAQMKKLKDYKDERPEIQN